MDELGVQDDPGCILSDFENRPYKLQSDFLYYR
jgi:hypothetical protein